MHLHSLISVFAFHVKFDPLLQIETTGTGAKMLLDLADVQPDQPCQSSVGTYEPHHEKTCL